MHDLTESVNAFPFPKVILPKKDVVNIFLNKIMKLWQLVKINWSSLSKNVVSRPKTKGSHSLTATLYFSNFYKAPKVHKADLNAARPKLTTRITSLSIPNSKILTCRMTFMNKSQGLLFRRGARGAVEHDGPEETWREWNWGFNGLAWPFMGRSWPHCHCRGRYGHFYFRHNRLCHWVFRWENVNKAMFISLKTS